MNFKKLKINASNLYFFKILIVCAAFYYLISSIDFKFKDISSFNIYSIILSFILINFFICIHALRWKLIIDSKLRISFKKILKVMYICQLWTNLIPSVIGFDGYRIFFLKKKSVDIKYGVFSVILDRFFGLISIVFFLALIISFSLQKFHFILNQLYDQKIIKIILVSFILLTSLIFFFREKIKLLFEFLLKIKSRLLIISFISLINVILQILSVLCLLTLFEDNIFLLSKYYDLIFISIIFIFLNTIPITPGNIGVSEFIIFHMLKNFNLDKLQLDQIVAGLIIYRVIFFLISMIGANFFLKKNKLY